MSQLQEVYKMNTINKLLQHLVAGSLTFSMSFTIALYLSGGF
jgi:hypothetical protein